MQSVKRNESPRKAIDIAIGIIVALGIIGTVAANYYFVSIQPALKAALSLLAIIILLGIASFTQKGKRFWQFAQDAKNELRRVVWPPKQRVIQTTIVVIVVVVIMALFLWMVDSILLWAVTFLTGQRG